MMARYLSATLTTIDNYILLVELFMTSHLAIIILSARDCFCEIVIVVGSLEIRG